MKEEFKESLLLNILKFGLILILSWFIMVMMFAIGSEGDEIDSKYNIYILIGGFVLAILISVVTSFNSIQRIKTKIPKLKVDIDSAKKMQNNLLDKANRVVDKYLVHESKVIKSVAEARTFKVKAKKVMNASDFKDVIESYPDLKSNEAIIRLLSQLEVTEDRLFKIKTEYTSNVAKYNGKIHSFPFVIFRKMFGIEDIEIEREILEEQVVSDEELGI